MLICPNCQHEEIEGAIFCSKCGAQFGDVHISTHKIHTSERRAAESITDKLKPATPTADEYWISLHLIESGQILPLSERTEYTLGRVAEGQPIVPDVDLSPYNAYANGVSRLHCAVKQVDKQVVIVDLGSSNGTYLNGTRLSPYTEMPVTDGDIVYLGKLKVQLLLS
jgi:hypothetical protein